MRYMFIALSATVASLALAAPALAGPPLIVHPFDIGTNASLPWSAPKGRADYQLARLVDDTQQILLAETRALVHMETLRRAAMYASRDRETVKRLLDALTGRATAAQTAGHPDPLAYLDTAYFTEAVRQMVILPEMTPFRDHSASVNDLVATRDGYEWIAKALTAWPNHVGIRYAAAVIGADRHRDQARMHAAFVRAHAAEDPLLARNLDHLLSHGN